MFFCFNFFEFEFWVLRYDFFFMLWVDEYVLRIDFVLNFVEVFKIFVEYGFDFWVESIKVFCLMGLFV